MSKSGTDGNEKVSVTENKNRDIAADQYKRFRRAMDAGHEEYIREAKTFDAFYRGEQWRQEDRATLEGEGRPVLTINNILPTVNIALGEQVAKRADIRFKAKRRGASNEVAKVLTRLTQHVLDDNEFSGSVEPEVYADGLIQDRGYYDIRIDFDSNIEGDIRITSENPTSVIIDPEAQRYDPKTWNEVFIDKWMTLDDIAVMYGEDKAEELKAQVSTEQRFDSEALDIRDNRFGDKETFSPGPNDIKGDKETVRSVRVIERQWRKLTNRKYFVDTETGDQTPVPDDWSDEQQQAFIDESEGAFVLISRREKRIRWTVTALHTVLHDDWSIYRSFTIVPYFPYFRRGRPFGLVRNLIGPQEFLNKTRSQELHIVNTTANSGWIIEEGSLANMTTDQLEESGAKTGIVISVNPGTTTAPQKIKPNPVPSGVDRISEKGQNDILAISGINNAMRGQEPSYVSGVAIERQTNRGQVQLQVPFSSLEMARRFVGQKILELVQDFYTEERVFFITDYSEPDEPQEEVVINQHAASEIVNNLSVGEYDVIVASSPARDTFDEMQFAEALALREAGVQVPSYMLVKYSHLSEKTELAKVLKRMEGFEEPTEEEIQMAQLQQQMMIADAQLELQEKEAKIAESQSRSALNMANVFEKTEGNMTAKELDFLHKRTLQQDNLQARLQMSQMSQQASAKKAREGNATRLTSDSMKAASNAQLEQMRALSRIAEKQITPPTPQTNKGTTND